MGVGFFAGLKLGVTCTNLQNSADVLINRHCERGILNKNMLSKANDIMRMNFLEIQDMCVEEATAIKLAAFYS